MAYDFDRIVHANDFSKKYDRQGHHKPDDVLPLWIADMDFSAPPCVVEALATQCSQGVFGYSEPNQGYRETLKRWFKQRFSWNISEDWLVTAPGVMSAVHIAIRALTRPEHSIIIQQPVYPPFAAAVNSTKRRLVVNELRYDGNGYSIDFDDFEKKVLAHKVKLFILCNPHNPIGRVWRRDELLRLGDICVKHGVTVVSDEIHQDLIYPGQCHEVFANLKPEYRDISITCTAPSKTFNLAGLQLANIFIPHPHLRRLFAREHGASGLSQPSLMGLIACKAAYDGGEDWLAELLRYLSGTIGYVKNFLEKNIPAITFVPPEATYLLWLNFRGVSIPSEELHALTLSEARLWLNDGPSFGSGGLGFQRMNIACPRKTVRQALTQLHRMVEYSQPESGDGKADAQKTICS